MQPICVRNVYFFAVSCTDGTPQYECINGFATMATQWVPDLPDIKGFSGQLCQQCLICVIQRQQAYKCGRVDKQDINQSLPMALFIQVDEIERPTNYLTITLRFLASGRIH